jgi:hypothetical protein
LKGDAQASEPSVLTGLLLTWLAGFKWMNCKETRRMPSILRVSFNAPSELSILCQQILGTRKIKTFGTPENPRKDQFDTASQVPQRQTAPNDQPLT